MVDGSSARLSLLDTVAARLADPFGRPETIVTLLALMGLLAVAYLVLYTLSDLRADDRRGR